MNNFLIILILLDLCTGLSNGFDMQAKTKVMLLNQLEHNKLLKVRCGNHKGEEKLLKIGEEYEFTFGDNFSGATNYSCKMDRGPDNFKHHQEFVVYDAMWTKYPEITCKWMAREDGIYYSQDGNLPQKKYEWEGSRLTGNKVTLRNELEHNKLLKVRCANDEGEHLLKIGEEYEFSFDDYFFHSCTMAQGPNNFKHHKKFCAYMPINADDAPPKWIAREDGIYFTNDGNVPQKKYEWDGPRLLKN
ncbi:unnamed protein product [Eruca vesicaria subsp. sativa]|uniref:S-protein homolog n=1 Tax=Eruca vesicaria subsp. sativa TaxID=29727 RepID=A0ABC8LA16_ERUVS|nr:unnamed protein product [Eruca vesicaria subsp. sativa]